MAFIKDSLNVKILTIVILVVVCMVSLVVVFHNNFEEITTQYKSKLVELNSTFENLTGTQKELNKTVSDLQLKKLTEADLRSKYSELKIERDSLENDVNTLNEAVKQKDVEISDLTFEVDDLNDKIDSLNTKLNKLQKRIDCFEDGGASC